MKEKKIPLRKCLATSQLFPKQDLIRIVKTPDNQIVVDVSGKINGRGAYISRSKEALEKAIKTNCLGKALEIQIPTEIYDRLDKIIK